MKKMLLLYFFTFCGCINIYPYNWTEISDSIAKQQKEMSDSVFHYKVDAYRDLRKHYGIRKYIDSMIVIGDTLIIMEYHRPQVSGSLNITMWIKGKQNSFMTHGEHGDYKRDFTTCFWSIYSRKLCENWDVAQIRKEESEHPEEPSYLRSTVMATRVIFKTEEEFSIDVLSFGYFYLYPRDRF